MIFNFRKQEKKIDAKELQIQAEKAKFHRAANQTNKELKKLNKVLSNGITLQIGKATHR